MNTNKRKIRMVATAFVMALILAASPIFVFGENLNESVLPLLIVYDERYCEVLMPEHEYLSELPEYANGCTDNGVDCPLISRWLNDDMVCLVDESVHKHESGNFPVGRSAFSIDRAGNWSGSKNADDLDIELVNNFSRDGVMAHDMNNDGMLITLTGVLTFQGDISLYGVIDVWPGEVIHVQADMPNSAAIDYDLFLLRTDVFGNILGTVDASFYTTYINGHFGTLSEAVGFYNNTSSIMYFAIAVQSFIGSSTTMPYTLHIARNVSGGANEAIQHVRNPRVASVNLPASGILTFGTQRIETLADNNWLRINVPANRNFDKISLALDSNSAAAGYRVEMYTRRADDAMRKIVPNNGGFLVTTGVHYVRVTSTGANSVIGANVVLTIAPMNEVPVGTITVGAQDSTWLTVSGRSGLARFPVTTQNIPAGSHRVTINGGTTAALSTGNLSINASGTGTMTMRMNGVANGVIVPAGTYSISITLRDSAGNLLARSGNFTFTVVPRSTSGPSIQGVLINSDRATSPATAQTILRTTCTPAQIRAGNRWNQAAVYNLFYTRQESWYRVFLPAGVNYMNLNPGGPLRFADVAIFPANNMNNPVFDERMRRPTANQFMDSQRFNAPSAGFYYIRIAGETAQNQEIRWTIGTTENVW